jgi:hypothetical protein
MAARVLGPNPAGFKRFVGVLKCSLLELGFTVDSIIRGDVYDGFKSPTEKQDHSDQITIPGYIQGHHWQKFRHAKDI